MAVFSPNLGGILNNDVILGQIFGRDGGSEEITKIFGWRISWVGLIQVLEGTPATRPAFVEFWMRSPTVDYHRRWFELCLDWFWTSGVGDQICLAPIHITKYIIM